MSISTFGWSFPENEFVSKKIVAVRTTKAPKIDGVLDEAIWEAAQIARDFTQQNPYPGEPSIKQTEVRVLYDNTAIYIGATMFDESADSIMRQLSNRDEEENTDLFGVFLDTYDDDQNAYGFVLHPTGVQWDARYSPSVGQDVSWDAVWMSATTIDDKNWYAELKIPYSAIRFPQTDAQIWGINFCRKIRRVREFSFWDEVDPQIDGFINQFGQIDGIEKIEAPVRLSVVPYVSGYLENYSDKPNDLNQTSKSLNGGLDLKYGINDAFTLDMTLIPDFGQVQSDNQVLNLSPFEVRFVERRPYFMEGTELFNKGYIFYSRRIGGSPGGFHTVGTQIAPTDSIIENPGEVQLINSSKVSGRTKGGLGIGVLNSVTGQASATVQRENGEQYGIQTEPLANYNVFVLDQSLKNNSFVSFVNTNVMREGDPYDANVSAGLFRFNTKNQRWGVNAGYALSQKYFSNADSVDLGHRWDFNVGKRSGNLQYNMYFDGQTDRWDPNDLGFNRVNNTMGTGGRIAYNIYKPFWHLLNLRSSIMVNYMRIYDPDAFHNFSIHPNVNGTFKNWLTTGVWATLEPVTTYDYFEPRVPGRFYTFPKNYNYGGFFSSDYRKPLALDGSVNYRFFDEPGRHRFNWNLSPRWRASDHLSFVYRFNYNSSINDIGWVNFYGQDIIFGRRDVTTMENIFNAKYIFTNRMGLTFRLRHYWSKAVYNRFSRLDENGFLQITDYTGIYLDGDGVDVPLHDVNFNAFNIDMVYTWVFAPGSEIRAVWKQNILGADYMIENNYFDNLNSTFDLPQTNSISLKVLYYLDYLSLRKRSS